MITYEKAFKRVASSMIHLTHVQRFKYVDIKFEVNHDFVVNIKLGMSVHTCLKLKYIKDSDQLVFP